MTKNSKKRRRLVRRIDRICQFQVCTDEAGRQQIFFLDAAGRFWRRDPESGGVLIPIKTDRGRANE